MKLPGLKATHAIITDACRQNRGDEGAIDEAIRRVRAEYLACVQAWPLHKGVKFNVILTVEAPPR